MAQLNLSDVLGLGVLGFLIYACVLTLAATAIPAAREIAHALRAATRRARRTDHH